MSEQGSSQQPAGWGPPASTGAPAPAPPGAGAPPPAWDPGPTPAWSPPPTKRRSAWPWIVGSVVLLAIALVLAVVLTDEDPDEGGRAVASGDDEGEIFEDPQGEYTIEVHPDWEQGEDLVTGVEVFFIGAHPGNVGTNVNLVSANDAFGADEASYVQSAERVLSSQGEVLDSGVVEGSDGTDRGFIEYRIEGPTGPPLRLLVIVDVVGNRSALATLTVPEDDFDEIRAEAEPYMRTIRAS